jgi:hypothetical protein
MKRGNAGRWSRTESCNTKWFMQCGQARCKQSSLKAIGYWVGQASGWGIHNHVLRYAKQTTVQQTKATNMNPTNNPPATPSASPLAGALAQAEGA